MKLNTYQTHVLIKQAIPNAVTVYERENPNGQMTFDEVLAEADQWRKDDDEYFTGRA
jgi:hypothetical protein